MTTRSVLAVAIAIAAYPTSVALADIEPIDPDDPDVLADPADPTPVEAPDGTPYPEPYTEPYPEPMPDPVMPAPVITPVVIPPPDNTTTESTTIIMTDTDDDSRRRAPIGISLTAGAGLSGFTSDALRGATQDGGGWDVRVGFATRQFIGFELGYLGTAQRIDALGLDTDAILVSNGAQANLRLNLFGSLPVTPFLFGGVAVRRYDLTNTASANVSDVSESDNVVEIPMGVGFAGRAAGFLLEARGEFRAAYDEDLVNTGSLNRYGATLNVGYEF